MKDELSRQLKTGAHDMSIIAGIAAKFTDRKKIENIQRKIQNEMKSERHSISAVAELKEVTDTSDNFLIYEMNDGNMNTKPSFVFKSSRKMAKMALNMDQDYPCKNPLMEEAVYFDGMHTRCKSWKTDIMGISSIV